MEKFSLIEKQVAARGLTTLKAEYVQFGTGTAMNDALLSGTLDFVSTEAPSLFVLWDKTRGGVRGVAALNATALRLAPVSPSSSAAMPALPAAVDAEPASKPPESARISPLASKREAEVMRLTQLMIIGAARAAAYVIMHRDAVEATGGEERAFADPLWSPLTRTAL